MPNVPSIGQDAVDFVSRAASLIALNSQSLPPLETSAAPRGDRVELSDHATLLEELRSLPDCRMEVVQRVRDAIATGTYVSDAKLDAAIDGLIQDLDLG
jgi:hypothetical protein